MIVKSRNQPNESTKAVSYIQINPDICRIKNMAVVKLRAKIEHQKILKTAAMVTILIRKHFALWKIRWNQRFCGETKQKTVLLKPKAMQNTFRIRGCSASDFIRGNNSSVCSAALIKELTIQSSNIWHVWFRLLLPFQIEPFVMEGLRSTVNYICWED